MIGEVWHTSTEGNLTFHRKIMLSNLDQSINQGILPNKSNMNLEKNSKL